MSGINRRDDLGALFSVCASLVAPGHQHVGQPRYLPRLEWPVRLPRDRLLRRVAPTIHLWLERARVRHELVALDDHVLKDIGLSRAQVEAEWRKPFWRA